MIRAIYRSVKIADAPAPYDTLTLKVFYPASPGDTPLERNTGQIPVAWSGAPFPVVVFFSGINVGMEAYGWLATALAAHGLVVVTFNWVAEDLPGSVSLTPGIDLRFVRPETYGSGASASALPAILDELARLNEDGVLAGALDPGRVVLGGHSAGGAVGLMNAEPRWFPQVCGAFAYGAHSGASTLLGFAPGTVLPLPASRPLLLVGGNRDGVVASSSGRYALDGETGPTLLLERTFDEATPGGRGDVLLAVLNGANHFSVAHPTDDTTGRHFLDWETTGDPNALRAVFAALATRFIDTCVTGRAESLDQLHRFAADQPLIARFAAR